MKVDKRSFRCIYLLFVLVLLLFDFCVPLNKQNNKIVDSKELKKGSSSNKNNNIVRKEDEKLDDGDKHNLKKSQHFISLQDSENDDDESTILIEKNGNGNREAKGGSGGGGQSRGGSKSKGGSSGGGSKGGSSGGKRKGGSSGGKGKGGSKGGSTGSKGKGGSKGGADKKKSGGKTKGSAKSGDKKKTGAKSGGNKKASAAQRKASSAKSKSDKKAKDKAKKRSKAMKKSSKSRGKSKSKSGGKSKNKRKKGKKGKKTSLSVKLENFKKKFQFVKRSPGELCKPNGEGGKNCFPVEKYPLKEAKKRMNGCCRPCQENFQNELSFLQLPSNVEKVATERYNAYASYHHLKSHLQFNHKLAVAKTATATASSGENNQKLIPTAVPSLAFIETHLLNNKNSNSISNVDSGRPTNIDDEFRFSSAKAEKGGKKKSKGGGGKKTKGGKGGKKPKGGKGGKKPKGSTGGKIPKGSTGGKIPNGGIEDAIRNKPMASGEEIQQMLPCCPICSEEFYAPTDFNDLNAFIEFKESLQKRQANRDMEADSSSSNNNDNNNNNNVNDNDNNNEDDDEDDDDDDQEVDNTSENNDAASFRFATVRTKKGGKGKKKSSKKTGKTSTKKGKCPKVGKAGNKAGKKKGIVFAPVDGCKPTKPAKHVPPSVAKASDTLEKRLTKKSLMKTCCKICPGDRYPGLGLNALQPAFIELMSKKAEDACCPICPTLASLSMAGAEPFGGPFGEGVGNMADAMTKAIKSLCKCYPNCPELIVQTVKGCRPQDIKTTLTSFIEVDEL